MSRSAKPSRFHAQCCQCGFFVDIVRGGLAHWLLCEQCGTQHVLKPPEKGDGCYAFLAFADGPRICPITPEMLAAHWEDEARRKKEHAERLLFRALPPEERKAIRRKEAEAQRREDRANQWALVWILPSVLLCMPLIILLAPVLGIYKCITERERKEQEAMKRQLDECLVGYRFIATVYPEMKTGVTGLPGFTSESMEHLACAHCSAEKSLVHPLKYLNLYPNCCPNCGAERVALREEAG